MAKRKLTPMDRVKKILHALFANKQTGVALMMAVGATLAVNTFAAGPSSSRIQIDEPTDAQLKSSDFPITLKIQPPRKTHSYTVRLYIDGALVDAIQTNIQGADGKKRFDVHFATAQWNGKDAKILNNFPGGLVAPGDHSLKATASFGGKSQAAKTKNIHVPDNDQRFYSLAAYPENALTISGDSSFYTSFGYGNYPITGRTNAHVSNRNRGQNGNGPLFQLNAIYDKDVFLEAYNRGPNYFHGPNSGALGLGASTSIRVLRGTTQIGYKVFDQFGQVSPERQPYLTAIHINLNSPMYTAAKEDVTIIASDAQGHDTKFTIHFGAGTAGP